MPVLPEKITGFRARTINALIDFCESLQPVRSSSVKHKWTSKGISYDVETGSSVAVDDAEQTFNCTLLGKVVSVSMGIMQIGDVSYEVSAGSVTLTGAVEYVYVYHAKDHSASGFGHSSTIPNHAGDQWKFILAKYAGSGGVYTQTELHHKGNIIAAFPTA